MFEKQKDALVYAQQLKKQNFLGLKVEAISKSEVRTFCQTSNYDCGLVKAGANVTPPTENGKWDGADKISCDNNECNPVKNSPR